jgi:hypothetical protein
MLVTWMMEALCSSATSVLTRASWHNIPEVCQDYMKVENIKNAVFWDVMPCGSFENRRFRGM